MHGLVLLGIWWMYSNEGGLVVMDGSEPLFGVQSEKQIRLRHWVARNPIKLIGEET